VSANATGTSVFASKNAANTATPPPCRAPPPTAPASRLAAAP
jgi:hypothetical protein